MRSDQLLGERVRVWDGQHASVRCEGTLIGIVPNPVLVIKDDDGVLHYESNGLPFDYEYRVWRDQLDSDVAPRPSIA